MFPFHYYRSGNRKPSAEVTWGSHWCWVFVWESSGSWPTHTMFDRQLCDCGWFVEETQWQISSEQQGRSVFHNSARTLWPPAAWPVVFHPAHYWAGRNNNNNNNTIIFAWVQILSVSAFYNWKLAHSTTICSDESSHHAKPLFKGPVNENKLYTLIIWIYNITLVMLHIGQGKPCISSISQTTTCFVELLNATHLQCLHLLCISDYIRIGRLLYDTYMWPLKETNYIQ